MAKQIDPEVLAGFDADAEVAPELLEVFALEAEDHLRTISTALPQLAAQPDNRELIQEVRRAAHTLKGSAAMVGFPKITRLAHRMEDLLDLLYEGSHPVTAEVIQLLHASTDALEDLAARRHDRVSLRGLYAGFDQLLAGGDAATAAVPAAARRWSACHERCSHNRARRCRGDWRRR
jgi:chemotaxis protein histidine kinase CheA